MFAGCGYLGCVFRYLVNSVVLGVSLFSCWFVCGFGLVWLGL